MNSTDSEVLRAAHEWLTGGQSVTLVTVARTWGSSPRPPGSLLAIRGDGRLVGSVSGGCLEDDLMERITTQQEKSHRPEVLKYGVTSEETQRFGLPCGGVVELVLEQLPDAASVEPLMKAIEARELLLRRLDGETGEAELQPGVADAKEFSYDGQRLSKLFGPVWRLLLIGAGQLSRYVAEMALALNYRVIVCDPREEYAQPWQVAGTELDTRMPDDVVLAMKLDPCSAVLTLTHDPRLDDMALMEALTSDAFYVGALGSVRSNEKRRERLLELDVPAAAIERLHGPVGLPIGSRTPPEIALAILAELTAARHGVRLQPAAEKVDEYRKMSA
ncbi:MAG: XdhC family protein [Gammaproteobacteria bacterium]